MTMLYVFSRVLQYIYNIPMLYYEQRTQWKEYKHYIIIEYTLSIESEGWWMGGIFATHFHTFKNYIKIKIVLLINIE